MRSRFDWIRQARTGAELLATLHRAEFPIWTSAGDEGRSLLGSPLSALEGPCQHCWIFPRASGAVSTGSYYDTCRQILKWSLGDGSYPTSILWGFVNERPQLLREIQSPSPKGRALTSPGEEACA